jgi:hypothetical protein
MKSKVLFFPKDCKSDGISITYVKSREVLVISGWFDSCVGIESSEISFKDFCDQLGIKPKKLTRQEAYQTAVEAFE